MRLLRTSVLLAVTLAVAGVAAQTAGGQSSAPAAAKDAPAAKKSTMPRTSWGKPDLEGTWDFRTVTPMERPAEFAGKATLTEKEAADPNSHKQNCWSCHDLDNSPGYIKNGFDAYWPKVEHKGKD